MGLRGQCLCGDVRFRIGGQVTAASTCSCSQCQRWAGSPWTTTTTPQDELVIENGAESIAWYPSSDDVERGFCVICGSSLFRREVGEEAEKVRVSAGTLGQVAG
ncbi:GFA family protein [Parvularcula maris]|uniref:GFA family protein n=1 Tax=Parvularcula maris TaxID=2965077 RepID=A0A9X2LBC3_9PROT|nr:GFA family protein [Parvularcula maris]MCQ8186580.1 GFA family protein [Parvularcula maris]